MENDKTEKNKNLENHLRLSTKKKKENTVYLKAFFMERR